LLNTIAATASTTYFLAHRSEGAAAVPASQVHGFTTAFMIAAVILFVAAMVVLFVVNASKHHLAQHDEVPVAAA
jgi:heme/copper-type cytochrome/quinol oxidase subunit 2